MACFGASVNTLCWAGICGSDHSMLPRALSGISDPYSFYTLSYSKAVTLDIGGCSLSCPESKIACDQEILL